MCSLRGPRLGIGVETPYPVPTLSGIQSRDYEQFLLNPGSLRDMSRHRLGSHLTAFRWEPRIAPQSQLH